MRATQFILTTFREDPGDAVIASHRLMLRAGLIHKLGSGLYQTLPLGLRVLRKVEAVVRQEMDAAGALECLSPILIAAELWQRSGRWQKMGKELFCLQDRHQVWNVLGPTHEETFTDTMKYLLKSYKDLPKNVYQIHTKFRDEVRPRFGVMRSREFIMKDAYSFHANEECLDKTYQKMRHCYQRIFLRLGLDTFSVEADSGNMGGAVSEEFMVAAEVGEETILVSPTKSYSANQEKTPVLYPPQKSNKNKTKAELKKVLTPKVRTIKEVSDFLKIKPEQILKAVLYIIDEQQLALIFLSGDREVNEAKLKSYFGAAEVHRASEEKTTALGLVCGFIGPEQLKVKIKPSQQLRNSTTPQAKKDKTKVENEVIILYDHSAKMQESWVIGANQKDHHYIGYVVAPEQVTQDLALARAGDLSPKGDGELKEMKGIELGHIFKLGRKYTQALSMSVLSKEGKAIHPLMGCYGIGLNRTMAAIIEQYHDEKGICWPICCAPYEICLVTLTHSKQEEEQAEKFYEKLQAFGCEVLWDDRDLRLGVKFNDAELIGFPLRITMGKSYFSSGKLEVFLRSNSQTVLMRGDLDELAKQVFALRNNLCQNNL